MRHTRLPVLFALAALCAGCTSYGPEELDRLTKEDPNFQQMIVARDQIHGEIRALRADLVGKKKVVDAQVTKLRGDYDAYAKAQNDKILKYQSVIESNRSILRRDIETAEAQLTAKTAELLRLGKSSGEVDAVLKQSKDITLSTQEKQKWEERKLLISEKMKPLADEIYELKARIRLNKRKIGYLK